MPPWGHTALRGREQPDAARTLRALLGLNGPVLLLRMPDPVATQGPTPDTLRPLLVHAETPKADDDRAAEAAGLVEQALLPQA